MRSIDELSGMVVDEAIRLHRELGPGLFESVYEVVLAGRLEARGLKVARQVPVPLVIDGHFFEASFSAKQLLTYLRLFKQPVGLLLNFSQATMKEGIRRVANDYRPA